jgi:hypothetical protein
VSLPAPFRFAVEAVFLVALGVALAAADLDLLPFVVVMAVAWMLVATAERMLSRPDAALSLARRRDRDRDEQPFPVRLARETAPETPRPEPEPEPVPEPAAVAEPEPAEVREAEPAEVHEAEPERALEVVPEPEPEPEPQPEPEKEEPEPVVAFPQGAYRRPDGWNLWDLEQRAHQLAGEDPIRDEEWNALLVSLRDYARPDGTLPPEFDALVQESFEELISRRP